MMKDEGNNEEVVKLVWKIFKKKSKNGKKQWSKMA